MTVAATAAAAKHRKGHGAPDRLARPAAGLEAEFTLLVDDRPRLPEHVFGDPRGFLDVPLLHRTGRSYHLPTGAAVYFDTGVIELATPVMELERGCFARLTRSLDDSLQLVRTQLDEWERRTGRRVRLQGFSTHYNVSPGGGDGRDPARFAQAAWLLAHVLPVPVMLLATNRLSTGVGVRPRAPRFEITADYSPHPLRVSATGAVVAGIVRAVSTWRSLSVASLRSRGVPLVIGFAPMAHTSRHGWLARFDCYPENPFACHPDAEVWSTTLGRLSLRGIARRTWDVFERDIARVADQPSYRAARDIVAGTSPSWLEDEARPAAYDDVGRQLPGHAALARAGCSRYERVVLNTIARRPLRIADEVWMPEAVAGWSRVIFRDRHGRRREMTLDDLLPYLDRWR